MTRNKSVISSIGVLFLTALLAVSSSGCKQLLGTVSYFRYSQEYDKQALEYCREVYSAFANKDSGTIEKLIAKPVADKHDIKAEAEKAFAFLDGEIDKDRTFEKTDDIDFWSPFHNIDSYDYSNNFTAGWTIKDVTTDKGTGYYIKLRICFAYKQNEDNVGIMDIAVVKRDDDYETEDRSVTIGEFIEMLSPRELHSEYVETPDAKAYTGSIREANTANMLCALGKGDSDWLYGQFTKSLQNDSLKEKITDVFDFIGGKATGFSSTHDGSGTQSVYYGTIREMTDEMKIYDVIGADGNVYQIEYVITYFDDAAPEKIGISYFTVSRVGGYDSDRDHIILDSINIGGNDDTGSA